MEEHLQKVNLTTYAMHYPQTIGLIHTNLSLALGTMTLMLLWQPWSQRVVALSGLIRGSKWLLVYIDRGSLDEISNIDLVQWFNAFSTTLCLN